MIALAIGCVIGFILGFNLTALYYDGVLTCTSMILIAAIIVIPFLLIAAVLLANHICSKGGLMVVERRW
jgi:hypothetical protein